LLKFTFVLKFGVGFANELSGWCFNERSKGIYASCVLVEKTEDLVSIFLFHKIFEPLCKHEVIHVKYSAEINKSKDCEDNFDAVGFFF